MIDRNPRGGESKRITTNYDWKCSWNPEGVIDHRRGCKPPIEIPSYINPEGVVERTPSGIFCPLTEPTELTEFFRQRLKDRWLTLRVPSGFDLSPTD